MKDDEGIFKFLTGGIGREKFYAEYWRKRFLYAPGAARSLLDDLPGWGRVNSFRAIRQYRHRVRIKKA